MFKTPRRLDRRLDRRNAAKNIAYSPSPRPLNLNTTNNNINNQSSFRVGDGDGNGDLDLLLYNLGLTGPEDFAISADAWEASRPHRSSSSSSDPLPRSRLSSSSQFQESEARVCDSGGISGARPPVLDPTEAEAEAEAEVMVLARSAPHTVSGTPEDKMVGPSCHQEDEEEIASTSNYGDSEEMLVVSPERKFRRRIESWIRGQLLGSGSFGTVYEAISHDGFFFALKEVSLLDQGNNAQQCILQLEQEITLLSQFEHENIVQYLGTDKEKAKLFIFIELVTQGSLASLYQKYHLQDSQVSSYTRQILKGLNYLHERNVVHRDIKCANILVHANGSVKLADFGLAKEMSKINMLKSCKGSVYWMAPEVVNPRKTYGPAADIWSLGCTVLEMLTRQIPHPDLEWQHAFFKIGRGLQPPVPSNLSKDARDFIAQCVQVNPDDRPAASQLLDHPFVKSRLPYSLRLGSDYSSSPGRDR